MAYEIPGAFAISVPAHDNLSDKQYRFVTLNSSGEAIAITGDTDYPTGILQNKPAAGEVAEIMLRGVSKYSADAGVNAGSLVGPSADGQGTTRTLVKEQKNKYISGQALDTVSNAGEIGTILLRDPFPVGIEA